MTFIGLYRRSLWQFAVCILLTTLNAAAFGFPRRLHIRGRAFAIHPVLPGSDDVDAHEDLARGEEGSRLGLNCYDHPRY
jgi:hypothetical protein